MRTKRLLPLVVACLLLVLSLPVFSSVYATESLIIDKADMLTNDEEYRLMGRIVEFIEKTDCHLTVITDTVPYDYYNTPAELDLIPAEDLILLTVFYTNSSYSYYLYTYGEAYSRLSDAEVNAILDAGTVYHNLKGGNIYDGLSAFISETQPRAARFALNADHIVPVLVISLIVAAICCGIVVARYKMKLKPTNYPLDKFAKLDLTEERDIFTGSFVTKRRISSSSGGSGRSGGGGGGRSGGGRGGR